MARFGRVRHRAEAMFVEAEGDRLHVLSHAPYLPESKRTGETTSGKPLCPVVPSKVVCIGRNYRAHAEELGNAVPTEPLLFLKPPSSLLDPGGVVELPSQSDRVEHEVELGIVIGARARDVRADDAMRHVFGYTVVGDITARDLQRSDKTWARGKGFDTFCPAGPQIVTDLDVSDVRVRCVVNDETRQDGTTKMMVFPPAELIAYISCVMTLEPGDLIATGTPSGVGPLVSGDSVTMSVEGIGDLSFLVQSRGEHAEAAHAILEQDA